MSAVPVPEAVTPRPTLTLYQASDALQIVEAWLEESGGELTPELESLLVEAHASLTDRTEAVLRVVRNHRALALARKAEAAALTAAAKTATATADRLEAYLVRELQRAGQKSVETTLGKFTVAASPPALVGIESAAVRVGRFEFLPDTPLDAVPAEVRKLIEVGRLVAAFDPSVLEVLEVSETQVTLVKDALKGFLKSASSIRQTLDPAQQDALDETVAKLDALGVRLAQGVYGKLTPARRAD